MVLAISPFSCFSDFLDLILARVLLFLAFLLEKTNKRTSLYYQIFWQIPALLACKHARGYRYSPLKDMQLLYTHAERFFCSITNLRPLAFMYTTPYKTVTQISTGECTMYIHSYAAK